LLASDEATLSNSTAGLSDHCSAGSVVALGKITPPVGTARTVAVEIVRVAPDFDAVSFQSGDGVRTASTNLTVFDQAYGALTYQTPALTSGTFQFQMCYSPGDSSKTRKLLGPNSQRCLPQSPIRTSVLDALPGRVRLQPGMATVDRFRDVQLTAHAVFLVNSDKYFRAVPTEWFKPADWLGGYINPSVGLQLGGSTSQLVLLMGGTLRLLEEAGLTFGLRFGNQSGSSTPYRASQNFYFGCSLDPTLFNALKAQSQSTPPSAAPPSK
jgi:hypothetical protein